MGALLLPPLAMLRSPWGVALGVLAIEATGAVAGWLALRKLGLAPAWHHSAGPALAGCAGLLIVCELGQNWPLAGLL